MNRGTENINAYAVVTSEIAKAIEDGAKDFDMPWDRMAHEGLPRNALTGNNPRIAADARLPQP